MTVRLRSVLIEFCRFEGEERQINQSATPAPPIIALKKPPYSKMKLVKVAYGNDDDQKSFQETQGLLQAYPDLKGIISPTTVGIAAAARYLQSSKYNKANIDQFNF